MNTDAFDLIEQAIRAGGAAPAFELLAQRFREEKNYPLLFETRLLEQRQKLGLPLLRSDNSGDIPGDQRPAYDEALTQAAKETGSLFLSDGDIQRAWPYFRAIGDREPVAAAIEKLDAAEEGVIHIALGERANPRKGFELLLGRHGICRAITYFDQYPEPETREQVLILLVKTLHKELTANLLRAITSREPETVAGSVPELVRGREWLFGDMDYYVDTSHLVSVIRFALDLENREALQLAIELCEYGKHLSPQFKYKSDPPFDDVYNDHAIYLGALAGKNVDDAFAHFRKKILEHDPAAYGTAPAQILVALLARLGRYQEAIDVSLEHLSRSTGEQLVCPSVFELCQLAGDFERLKKIARQRGDLLAFAAASMTS